MLRELQRYFPFYPALYVKVRLTAVRGSILFIPDDDEGALPSSLTVLVRVPEDLGFFCSAEF